MEIICGWCNHTMGEKPGPGTTHGICPACLEHELASLASYAQPLDQAAQDLLNCFYCHVTASTSPLVLSDGQYVCFACLPRHRHDLYGQLLLWCLDKTLVPTH